MRKNGIVEWSNCSPDNLVSEIELGLEIANRRIEEIERIEDSAIGYDSVVSAMESATDELDFAWSLMGHMTNVADSKDLREKYSSVLPKVTSFYSGIYRREQLWEKLKYLLENDSLISELMPLQRRHFEELIEDFKESGAALNQEQRNQIAEIDRQLAELGQTYSENVLDSTNDWQIILEDESLLNDFPPLIKELARDSALSKGYGTSEEPKWRFSLQAPSYVPFMRYIADASLRKEAWAASNQIGKAGKWNNQPIVLKMIELRHQKAKLLGYDDFADYILNRRMAKSGESAKQFIKKLKEAVSESVVSEVQDLQQFRSESLHSDASEQLEPWDVAFWSEKMLNEKHQFDDERLRPYFSLERVMQGLFQVAETIFGITIKECSVHVGSENADQSIEVWDELVRYYEIFDASEGHQIGAFYADWFPRENKRAGAWMDTLRSGCFGTDGKPDVIPLGIICGNLTPPSESKPSLLTHGEVETIFHEFGHLLHEICGEVSIKSLNGISVPWDFVEVPSQMLENWCWERESLDVFATHYETGECIPQGLFEKMKACRNFQKGMQTLRQLCFGIMDLELHTEFAKLPETSEQALGDFLSSTIEEYQPKWKTSAPPIVCRFGHLFSDGVGYAAGYYSYQWSEVLEADAFGAFLEEGIMNRETGLRFRRCILSKGNSQDPKDMFIAFRGREPEMAAYLERAGLAAPNHQ